MTVAQAARTYELFVGIDIAATTAADTTQRPGAKASRSFTIDQTPEQLSCLSRGPRMLLHTFCHSRLPPLLVFDHRIENRQQFAHTRGQGHFFRFARRQ